MGWVGGWVGGVGGASGWVGEWLYLPENPCSSPGAQEHPRGPALRQVEAAAVWVAEDLTRASHETNLEPRIDRDQPLLRWIGGLDWRLGLSNPWFLQRAHGNPPAHL